VHYCIEFNSNDKECKYIGLLDLKMKVMYLDCSGRSRPVDIVVFSRVPRVRKPH
jgi:hypothetical protein